MLDFLQANSALPSLHPAIIHFPVAVVIVAFLFRAISWIRPNQTRWSAGADMLGAVAALGAIGAFLSGRQAADSAGALMVSAEVALARHADMAQWATGLLITAALIPLLLKQFPFSGWMAKPRFKTLVNLIALFVAVVVVTLTADLGGALVYDHGVGVSVDIRPNVAEHDSPDHGEVGKVLDFPGDNQIWEYQPGEVLELLVDGTGLIALPGKRGDGVLNAVVDPGNFQGEITLVHRYINAESWEGFRFSTEGSLDLLRMVSEGESNRDNTAMLFPREKFSLGSASVSGHFKGLVDNEVVVHGHGDSGAPGRAGLLVSGLGKLRISSISAEDNGD